MIKLLPREPHLTIKLRYDSTQNAPHSEPDAYPRPRCVPIRSEKLLGTPSKSKQTSQTQITRYITARREDLPHEKAVATNSREMETKVVTEYQLNKIHRLLLLLEGQRAFLRANPWIDQWFRKGIECNGEIKYGEFLRPWRMDSNGNKSMRPWIRIESPSGPNGATKSRILLTYVKTNSEMHLSYMLVAKR